MIAARWSCLVNSESHSRFKIRFRGKKKKHYLIVLLLDSMKSFHGTKKWKTS